MLLPLLPDQQPYLLLLVQFLLGLDNGLLLLQHRVELFHFLLCLHGQELLLDADLLVPRLLDLRLIAGTLLRLSLLSLAPPPLNSFLLSLGIFALTNRLLRHDSNSVLELRVMRSRVGKTLSRSCSCLASRDAKSLSRCRLASSLSSSSCSSRACFS